MFNESDARAARTHFQRQDTASKFGKESDQSFEAVQSIVSKSGPDSEIAMAKNMGIKDPDLVGHVAKGYREDMKDVEMTKAVGYTTALVTFGVMAVGATLPVAAMGAAVGGLFALATREVAQRKQKTAEYNARASMVYADMGVLGRPSFSEKEALQAVRGGKFTHATQGQPTFS